MDTQKTARDMAHNYFPQISPKTSVKNALELLLQHKLSSSPVLDDKDKLVGMFSVKDAIKPIMDDAYYDAEKGIVDDVMSTALVSVDSHMSILEMASIFLQHSYHHIPVLEDGRLIGVVNLFDLAENLERAWIESENEKPQRQPPKVGRFAKRFCPRPGSAIQSGFDEPTITQKKKP